MRNQRRERRNMWVNSLLCKVCGLHFSNPNFSPALYFACQPLTRFASLSINNAQQNEHNAQQKQTNKQILRACNRWSKCGLESPQPTCSGPIKKVAMITQLIRLYPLAETLLMHDSCGFIWTMGSQCMCHFSATVCTDVFGLTIRRQPHEMIVKDQTKSRASVITPDKTGPVVAPRLFPQWTSPATIP